MSDHSPGGPAWVARMKSHPVVGSIIAIIAAVALVLGVLASWVAITGRPLIPATGETALTRPTASSDLPSLTPDWSPERPTFTIATPAAGPALNSITDDPNSGNELDFVTVRIAGDKSLNAAYRKSVRAKPGQSVQVHVVVSNDAMPSLGAAGTVHGLAVTISADSGSNGALIEATLNADDIDGMWSSALVSSDGPLKLTYVKGSGQFRNSTGDHTVPDSLGKIVRTKLGSDKLNGTMKVGLNPDTGINFDVGYLAFIVKVEAA